MAATITHRRSRNPWPALVLPALLAACGGAGDMPGDTQPPTVALSSPGNYSAGLTGLLSLTATATDDTAVAGVEFQIDGVTIGSEDGMAPYLASLDADAYAPGQHVLRARARDGQNQLSAWSAAAVAFTGPRGVAQGFTKNEAWVTGLVNATAFAQAPDGRLFVCEQGGTLRVVKNGVLLAAPFHTFADIDSGGERGLLGVAFHPGFAGNGFVYVYRTSTSGGTHNRVSRLVASAGNPDVSDGAETVLVNLPTLSAARNHNGGAIHFGGDGKLYVGVGDNANGANAQDLSSPLGKLLRLNDDGSIPGDNPFYATQSGLARAIWVYGLRNPFTFAMQPGSGRIHINDVGESTWEEINVATAGSNYGWPASEGPDNVSGSVVAPLFAYKHTAAVPPGTGPGGFFVGRVIAGGTFYPTAGGSFPAGHAGNYFFADYLAGFIGRLDPANGWAAYGFAKLDGGGAVDLLVGSDGALYGLKRSVIARISAP